jgi:hypothetical protein
MNRPQRLVDRLAKLLVVAVRQRSHRLDDLLIVVDDRAEQPDRERLVGGIGVLELREQKAFVDR